MATDFTDFGRVEKFEDFLVTALADLPEIDSQGVTGDTPAVVAGGADGRVRHAISTSNDDDIGGLSFGALNWTAGDGDLYFEARFFLSAVTDIKVFVGFGDSIVTTDETTFSATTDTITIDTMSYAFGLLYDEYATTKQVWAVAGLTDAVTVNTGLGTDTKPLAATATTWGCFLSRDRRTARFYINGKMEHEVVSATALVGAVDLVPMVVGYEQGTAFNLDIDYMYGRKDRSDS